MKKAILIVIIFFIIGVVIGAGFLIKKELIKGSSEKVIEIKYFSDKPGFGYSDLYIINNSGKYIWISSSDYWMNRLDNPKPKFYEQISYDELLALYTQIKDKGFFNWTGDYSSMAKNYAGGSATQISISTEDKKNNVSVFGNFGPSKYYEVETLIKAQYPEKRNCSLKNQEDFPKYNLSEHGPSFPSEYICPDPYYIRYYDECTCI